MELVKDGVRADKINDDLVKNFGEDAACSTGTIWRMQVSYNLVHQFMQNEGGGAKVLLTTMKRFCVIYSSAFSDKEKTPATRGSTAARGERSEGMRGP